jgi:hypothetical protein
LRFSQSASDLTKQVVAAAMERRKTPRKNWVIGKDEVGRSVLEWKPDPIRAKHAESDPNARTYDFLKRLDHPDLSLEDDGRKAPRAKPGFNPYDREPAKPPKPKYRRD